MKIRLTWTLCVLVIFLFEGHSVFAGQSYRLPQTCRPSAYELHIRPDFYNPRAAKTLNGSVVITVTCTESTNRMTLHQRDLDILDVTVTSDQEELRHSVEEDRVREFYTIVLTGGEVFRAHTTYTLKLVFKGLMREHGYGLYYSSYTNAAGETVGLAATQLEATEARTVFPCFDEPGFKSTFKAHIARRTDTGRQYSALFNTPRLESRVDPEDSRWTIDSFDSSPVMPVYLVAIVISDFEAIKTDIDLGKVHNGRENGSVLPYGSFGRPGHKKQLEFSHEIGVEMFTWLDKNLQPPYEKFASKIDSVSEPKLKSNGMENWGLVTYNPRAAEYTEGVTSIYNLRVLTTVTAHELIHQWFGNTVTCEWWDSIWLNEGFALFWQYHLIEQVYPSWKEDELSVSIGYMDMMPTDGSWSSHALYHPVQTPSQIGAMFSRYTYTKGGTIVRMAKMILGDHFIPAVNHYLNKHQLTAVTSEQMWTALNEHAQGQNFNPELAKRMVTWVEQKGHPVLKTRRNSGGDEVTFSQEYFPVENMDTAFKPPYGNRFDIPVIMTSSTERQKGVSSHQLVRWLLRDQNEMTLNMDSGASWYVVNERHMGYYRVLYDEDNYRALHRQLMDDHEVFDPLTRATILDDAFHFHQAGGKFEDEVKEWPFLLTQYLKKELSFAAWHVFQREMAYISRLLLNYDETMADSYKSFITRITGPVLEQLTLDIPSDIPYYDTYLRSVLANLACPYHVDSCVSYATTAVNKHMSNPSAYPLNVNLRSILYCGAMGGDKNGEIFESYIASFGDRIDYYEKIARLTSLACTRDSDRAVRFLKDVLDSKIPGLTGNYDMELALEPFAASPHNYVATRRFLVDNFDAILDRAWTATTAQTTVKDMLQYLSSGTAAYDMVQPLLTKMKNKGSTWRKLANDLEATAVKNAAYVQKYRDAFNTWLRP